MTKLKVLTVEDDSDIRELLRFSLEQNDFEAIEAKSGEEGLGIALSEHVDLVLLDLMLPGIDGYETCKRLKKVKAEVPVIMLTAKAADYDQLAGFDAGADDYVAKPFSPKTVMARIKAILRRTQLRDANCEEKAAKPSECTVYTAHGIVLDTQRYMVTVNKKPIDLSLTEFHILAALLSKPGWVFSRDQLINASRGGVYSATERSVDVQILGLRRKLGEKGRYIETVRGVGYRILDKDIA